MTASFFCFFHFVFNLCSRFGRANIFQCLFLGGAFPHPWGPNRTQVPPAMVELQHNSERWRQRATNVGMEPEDGGNGRWRCRGPCREGDMEGTEMKWCFGNFPRCFVPELWLVVFFGCAHPFCFFLGSEQIFFWKVMHFYNFEFSHPHRLLQEFGDMAQHTKAVLKSVSIAPVDPTGEKGVLFCCESFFAASKSEHMWQDNSASYIFSEWLYCKIAIIFGVQNTIDTSFVQQDFLPSLFRVKVFAYPASWCKRLPTRWWF